MAVHSANTDRPGPPLAPRLGRGEVPAGYPRPQELLLSPFSLVNESPFSPLPHHLLPKNPHIMENPEEVFLEKGILKIYGDAALTPPV